VTTTSVQSTGRGGLAVGLAALLLAVSVPQRAFAFGCDYVVTALTVNGTTAPVSLSPGELFTINVTVTNQRFDAPAGDVTLQYLRSDDSTISTGDMEIGTDTVPQLSTSTTLTSMESIMVSESTPGTYFIGACVGVPSGEFNTTNNCSSGVQIMVNTPPTISSIADQNIPQNGTTGAIGFTVSDVETLPGSLTVTASSSNITLIPNANVVLSGAGADRTITVTPAADQSGNADITVTVFDGRDSTDEIFNVIVEPPDLVVSALTVNGTTGPVSLAPGESFTIDATVDNVGGGESASTTLSYFQSDDSDISPTDDTDIGMAAIGVLGGGTSFSPPSFGAIAPMELGPFFIGACVDTVGGETTTGNNCFTPGLQITVAPPGSGGVGAQCEQDEPVPGRVVHDQCDGDE